ncbi:alpha/beta hydrolase [Paraburkholderia saeva]|uniref:Carboxylesterase NlhH n=1 Tax=Paraburkholderia saeva TaxID=2777537 RepID=A0A9N8X4U0_9BURK|nr:alpha/beta hydrolase [Paraburkholderia saeva]CAG4892411.1 Carboxylesterase NlhH [Paraburkholderia saeva]CAG4920552.1 Carboxylesterase NlhH [Paraburkholderia saeva]CAG4923936.1 Carboxylesterase NlhH [Paraburkholderia saeva]
MPLNPKIKQVLEMIAKAKRPEYHTLTPQQARAAYERSAPILEIDRAPMFSVEDIAVPVRDGASIRARLYYPVEPVWAEPAPAFVYFHGGGFTVGSVDTHDALCRMFARDGRCVVMSVDYRLAPEYRFPTAANDAFDALTWLYANAAVYGVDPQRLAVGGDSAGGTLATVSAVLARDAGIRLALQLLIYPGTTGHQQTASHARLASGFLLSGETIQWFFEQYVRDPADRDDWRFAPLDGHEGYGDSHTGPDFHGVAPAWIATAQYDPLSDEGAAYADKLRAAGNTVTLKTYAGMIHEFFKMGGFVPDVAEAHADAAAALRAAFGVDD